MTANEFRKLALDLPEVAEAQHMNHPDFRVRGKIFATLAYPDKTFAMVKLSLPDQRKFTQADKETFALVPGFWGEHGCNPCTPESGYETDCAAGPDGCLAACCAEGPALANACSGQSLRNIFQ